MKRALDKFTRTKYGARGNFFLGRSKACTGNL